MSNALDYPCTVCSAAIGQSCRDRLFQVLEVPHWNRRRVAGEA